MGLILFLTLVILLAVAGFIEVAIVLVLLLLAAIVWVS